VWPPDRWTARWGKNTNIIGVNYRSEQNLRAALAGACGGPGFGLDSQDRSEGSKRVSRRVSRRVSIRGINSTAPECPEVSRLSMLIVIGPRS